jgi:multicomponent Na+:H+ antiporter subunit B
MNKERAAKLFDKWRSGNLDTLSGYTEKPKQRPKKSDREHTRHTHERLTKYVDSREETVFRNVYRVLSVVFALILISVLLFTISGLPRYGSDANPTINEVPERYLEKGMEETGAVNAVAGMILDYRAFDTLGESFVLFTATCAVLILLREDKSELTLRKDNRSDKLCRLSDDAIVRVTCKMVIPIIMMLGIYVLLNGHLGPGGGFAGGAILGAGLILYAQVMGFDKASGLLTEKVIKGVTVVALGFYCIIKSYSFFTGANHLPSIITAGVPGRIFSAGVILPLNIAVGMVVACTMYSFYAVFRRGHVG